MKKRLKQFLLCAMSGILFFNTPMAVFAENADVPERYELNITSTKGGTVSVEGQDTADSYHFEKDEKVTLHVDADEGYALQMIDTEDIEDFLDESTESEISFLMPDHKVDLRFIFEKQDVGDSETQEKEIAERKKFAKEKGLEDWIDEDGYLIDDFYEGKSDLEINQMDISSLVNSIDLNGGTSLLNVTKYQKVQYGNTIVGYFEVDGKAAMCCEHDRRTPEAGSSTGTPEKITDNNLRRVMYYGYTGPGNIFSNYNKGCVATSLALSYYVRGIGSTGMSGPHSGGAQKCGMSDLIYKAEQGAYVPDNYVVYRVTTNGGSTQRLMYGVTENNTFKNTIKHWMTGFEHKEGNNGDAKYAFCIGIDDFYSKANSSVTVTNEKRVTIPRGFYLDENRIYVNTTGEQKSLPYTYTSTKDMNMEYWYRPYTYSITYDLNGGTQAASYPTSYNVIYEKTLPQPTKSGYTFSGWIQEGNLLGNGPYNYTFTNTIAGNRYSFSKIQLFKLNPTTKKLDYTVDIIDSSANGHVSEVYTHNIDTGLYAVQAGANANIEDKRGDYIHNIYFQKGAQYRIEYDLSYSQQKIEMKNVSIKRITPVKKVNIGATGTALATNNYFAESLKRQMGNVKLKANWTKQHTLRYDAQGGSMPTSTVTSNSSHLIIPNGDYTIRSAVGSQSRYIHAEHDGWNNIGPNVCLFNSCSDGTNYPQTVWTFERYKNTEYYYITNKTSGRALKGSKVDGLGSLTLEPQEKNDSFLWKITGTAGGQVSIVNKNTSKCIDLTNSKDVDGTKIIAYNNNGNANQKWYLNKIAGSDYTSRYEMEGLASVYVNSVDPVRADHEFLGWNTKKDGTGTMYQKEDLFDFRDDTDVTLYAQWKSLGYKVKFHSNGGTGSMDDLAVPYGKDYTLPANTFTMEGYKFKDWLDKNRSTTWKDKGTINYTKNQTNNGVVDLYAEWSPIEYDIVYNSNKPAGASGTITGSTASSHHKYDESKNLTANGYKLTGWTFTGWKDSNGNTYSDQQAVKNLTKEDGKKITFYAQWKPNTYTVKYNSNKPSNATANVAGTTPNSNHTYDKASNLSSNGYSLTGWVFTGWKDSKENTYTDKASVKNLTSEPNGTVTLYAQWKPNSYTIRYDSNKPSTASGNITGTTTNSTHSFDTAKNLTANGYKLTGWTFTDWKDSNGKTYTDKQSVKNLTTENGATVVLYAQWKPNTYTIHYDGNGATSGSTPDSNMTYDKPGTLNKNGFKKDNATFIGWKDETGKSYKDGQTVSNLTPNDKGVVKLIAQWDLAPEIKANDKTYYEGMTVTRADLLKDVVANDKEDGVITNKLIITKIEYSAGKLVNGKKQAAYTQEWANGMPADAKLDTWFMQLDKADSPVKHKVTYKVFDKVGNVTTKTVNVYVKYNNAPVITTIDRYYTLKEAQSGVISADELLKNSITNNKMKSTDIEEGNLSSKVELVDFNPADFTKLTTNAVVTVTYRVHDSYGPNGVGKETINQFKVHITDPDRPPIRPDDPALIVKHVRFITKKYYDLNKNKSIDLSDEELAKANANGGLRVGCSWYSNPEYKSEITATFDKTSGTTYKFSHEDVEKIQDYINTNGIGNAKKANSLSTFYQKFLNK
mgnify:CR=1 FL=1